MANQLDNIKVGDLVENFGATWRVTEINGDYSICFENIDKNSPMSEQAIMGKWKENFERMGFVCKEKPVFYALSENVHLSDTVPDNRLSLSHIGLLAILLTYFTPETEFSAEDFGEYTYEDVSVAAENLSALEKYGYVHKVH